MANNSTSHSDVEADRLPVHPPLDQIEIVGVRSNSCPECGGEAVTQSEGEVCQDCGLIIEESDRTTSRRRWTQDEDGNLVSRGGSPETNTLHDKGLQTEIGNLTTSGWANASREARASLVRIQQLDNRLSQPELNLVHGLQETNRILTSLGYGRHVRERSSKIFRTGHEQRIAVGRTIIGLAAASAYLTIRLEQLPTSRHELLEISLADISEFKPAYAALKDLLQLPIPQQHPKLLIPKACSALQVEKQVEQATMDFLAVIDGTELFSGKKPSSTAALAIYVVCRDGLYSTEQSSQESLPTQKEIAEATGISPNTLSRRWTDYLETLESGSQLGEKLRQELYLNR